MRKNLVFLVSLFVATSAFANQSSACGETNGERAAGMIENYLRIQTSLANDSIDQIPNYALAIHKAAADLQVAEGASACGMKDMDAEKCKNIMPNIAEASATLSKSQNIEDARLIFGELSESMIEFRNMIPGEKPKVAYCGMVKKAWLQSDDEISNPYYGSSMLRCGSLLAEQNN